MNCNDGKCSKIRKEGIIHEENICLKLNKKNTYIESIKNKTHAVLNIKHKSFYISVIITAITISLVNMMMYYFTDINLMIYHNCIADTIRGNGTINISQFTACTTDYSEISQASIAFVGMAIVIAISFICHNIMFRRELNSIDDKLNKNMNMHHENIFL